MNCDNDDAGDSDTRQQLTNWLDAKKAEKARNVNRPTLSDRLSKELDSYLAEPNEEETSNPLSWWCSHQSQYPSVAAVAKVYLAIPATSVPSERVFSKCGRVCSERRSMLSPQHVEHPVFFDAEFTE
jgi:hypothetical protein